ncbi:PD-(D/E)XK nuclease family protein [Bowdeniella nasicola]|uniref:PD-(D/E)XK nuclease family protein n=1 Tax=Bowdeniella nasicola TaxID=208480 RepID=UPI0009FAEED4|nr:PD-(D/E)XK nuclease family protein [Bowdeniella nasicola]
MTAPRVRIIDVPRRYAALSAETLTDQQRAFVEHSGPISLAVGGPGTGKTSAVIEKAHAELAAGHHVVVLGRGRLAADELHSELRARLGDRTPMRTSYTMSSLAFALLALRAESDSEPPPRMVTGAETDAVLTDIIADVIDRGPEDPTNARIYSALAAAGLPDEILGVERFRHELRDSIMRAQECDRGPGDICALADEMSVPVWHLVAEFYERYEQLQSLASATEDQGERLDVSALVAAAAGAVRHWPAAEGGLPDWVIIDDAHELTNAGWALVDALRDHHVRIALVANPDQSVEIFRGARPDFIAEYGPALPLSHSFLHPESRGAILRDLAASIPTAGLTVQRHWQAESGGEKPVAHVLPTASQEEHHVVNLVRSFALTGHRDELGATREEATAPAKPYSLRQIAIVTRSSADAQRFARALRHAGIQVQTSQTEVLLSEEPAIAPLLSAARIAVDYGAIVEGLIRPGLRGGDADRALTTSEEFLDRVDQLHESVRELLTSPLIRVDPADVRRIMRACAAADAADSTGIGTAQGRVKLRLIEACLMPPAAALLPAELQAGPRKLAEALKRASTSAANSEPAESVLWDVWEECGRAEIWRDQALAGGLVGATADHNLDAVMALFKVAATHAERNFGASASVFLDDLERQSIPTDTLADHGQIPEAVSVLTVGQAAGRHWPVVIIPGLYDGAWPDTRIRDTTLRWQSLVDIFSGRQDPSRPLGEADAESYAAARRETIAGELRMFLAACACASEHLILTSVDDGETLPSVLVTKADPNPTWDYGRRQLSPRGMVAALRAALEDDDTREAERAQLAARLATLARLDVPGADPATWPGLWEPTTTAEAFPPEVPASLGPSDLESILTCPLRRFLERAGAQSESTLAMNSGTLIHQLAEEYGAKEIPENELRAEMRERLDELLLEFPLPRRNGWEANRVRQELEIMTDRLAQYLASHQGKVELETKMKFDAHGLHINGRLDRIEHNPEGARIVDFKTSSKAITGTQAQANPQLALYQYAYEKDSGAPSQGATLVYLKGESSGKATTRVQSALSETEINMDEYLTTARTFIERGEKKAFVNGRCGFCPVRSSCPAQPEGQRVV